MKRTALLAMLAAACGQWGQAEDSTYQGVPLFTVSGQLLATTPLPAAPIHLAMVWWPFPTIVPANPQSHAAIVTQEVTYDQPLPLSYTFNLYTLPPASALGDFSQLEGEGHGAAGILVAYLDLNGNGQLDTIPPGGQAIDEVLGISTAPSPGGAAGDTVYYVDGAIPYYSQVPQGFVLVQSEAVAPAQAQVPLYLSAPSGLDWIVCEQLLDTGAGSADGGSPCDRASNLRVVGQVGTIGDSFSGVYLSVTDADFPGDLRFITDATVLVDGQPVMFNPATGIYDDAPTVSLSSASPASIQVGRQGYPSLAFDVALPGAFSILAPDGGTPATSGAPLAVSWSPSVGADGGYQLEVFAEAGGSDFQSLAVESAGASTTTATFSPISYVGAAGLEVVAQGPWALGANGSQVAGQVGEEISLTFEPAP